MPQSHVSTRLLRALPLLTTTFAWSGIVRAQGIPSTLNAPEDTAFHTMQQRGAMAMGVYQYTSRHRFDALPNGGRIELQRLDDADSAGITRIRVHLRSIAQAFKDGDFSTPMFVHMRSVPGACTMAAKRNVIGYAMHDLPAGGELMMTSADTTAVRAIHSFIAFQRDEHHASGSGSASEAPAGAPC